MGRFVFQYLSLQSMITDKKYYFMPNSRDLVFKPLTGAYITSSAENIVKSSY